jgi:hypothetical protein
MVEIDRGGPESASERCDDRIWYQIDGRYLGSETNVEGSYKWQLCSECFHACYHFPGSFSRDGSPMIPDKDTTIPTFYCGSLGMISLWASRPRNLSS